MKSVIEMLYEKIKNSNCEEWILSHDVKYNIYSSIDIRCSGYKIAPVDVNAFPAGFNNLEQAAIQKAASIISKTYQQKKFLILPENHNRNLHYNDNLLALKKIIEASNNQVVIGHNQTIFSTDNTIVPTSHFTKKDNIIVTKDGYIADIILINNDMISGLPEILRDISQEMIPHPHLGWYQRRKSDYFNIYNEVVQKFCRKFNIDEWLISTFTNRCQQINFSKKEGLECIALEIEKMLKKIKNKYQEYAITDRPYIFVKADNGSYGMGIMTVSSAEDVMNFNKDKRKKMNVTKGKSIVTDVLLQEGVPTIDQYAGNVAEPLVYCIMNQPIGFLYRYHEQQCQLNNLNKVGAKFHQMENNDKYIAVLSLISRLSLLAGAIELEHYNESK